MQNSEVRQLHTGKRGALHDASETNRVWESYLRKQKQAFLPLLNTSLACPAPSPFSFYSVP